MRSALRKMKRSINNQTPAAPINLKLLDQLAYNRGYDEGTKAQRAADIKFVVSLLEDLEKLPGVGEKTAHKVRYLIASQLEKHGHE